MAQRTREDYDVTLTLLYPDRRRITVREIITWAKDRMCDNAIEVENLHRRSEGLEPLNDEEIEKLIASVETPTLEDAMERLQDDGVATFGRN